MLKTYIHSVNYKFVTCPCCGTTVAIIAEVTAVTVLDGFLIVGASTKYFTHIL